MEKKEIDNPIVVPMLKQMCEISGHVYDEINWTNGSHKKLIWSAGNQIEFLNWLVEYIYNLKMNEIALLVDGMPILYYKKKKKARNLAAEFVYRLGFLVLKEKKSLKK